MSSRLLTALKHLLTTVVVIVASWLAVCVVAMLTGHTDVLPAIGAVLVDLIEALITFRCTTDQIAARDPLLADLRSLSWQAHCA